MNSYDKKKATIEIYELMKDNIQFVAMEMISKPNDYTLEGAARLILDEIKTRMLEIYKL